MHKTIFGLMLIVKSSLLFAQSLSTGTASDLEGVLLTRGDYACTTPHQCEYQAYDTMGNLAYPGNGFAQPAVALNDWLGVLHEPMHINDGYYGNGSAWVATSYNSWIKIDLGKAAAIDSIKFGRDRIFDGVRFDDRDPGNFIIEVADLDAVYSNANEDNDLIEYTQVFAASFDGKVDGNETLEVTFNPPVDGRFVKITFASLSSSYTAIDEIEVFGSSAPVYSCAGFQSPMAEHPVRSKKNRVFPLKMELFDEDGFEVMSDDVTAPPVVQVLFTADSVEDAVDVSDYALSAGNGSDGNEFDFTEEGIWQFNLKSRNYSANGNYLVTVISGDELEYKIDHSCFTSFSIN